MFGSTYNSVFINNNGNISFGRSYPTFSSTGFPVNGYPMVAPFWSDVDTRAGSSGVVWYKSQPHRFTVIWDHVGYFDAMANLRNTFQLIISDGTDSLVGVGNNVCLCYDDMQWTTGSASNGTGGFGGVPATVGLNAGDGINYFTLGRFDHAGVDYNGPSGPPSGVSWLDNYAVCLDASPIGGPVRGDLVHHFDGTTEFTARGVNAQQAKDLLQRIPGDQICGARSMTSFTVLVQDQDAATPEGPVSFLCLGNDGNNGPRPDYIAAPLGSLALGGITFPGTGVSALRISASFSGIPVPGACPSPAGDVYAGLRLPAVNTPSAWPLDGISVHISVHELSCASGVPYPANPTPGGPTHTTNLGWDVTNNAVVPTSIRLAPLNLAWRIGCRFAEDTLQPFADNPVVFVGGAAGSNPNFGAPGIWPDQGRGDRLGFNVQTSLGVGSPYLLMLGDPWCVPVPFGLLLSRRSVLEACINPGVIVMMPATVSPGACLRDPAATQMESCSSQVSFGPFVMPPGCGFGPIHLQAVGLDGGANLQFSTGCRVNL